jgi:hypothetical protein
VSSQESDPGLENSAGQEMERGPGQLLRRARWLLAFGGPLAGLCAFVLGETVYNIIPVKLVLQDVMMTGKKALLPSLETENAAMAQNAALSFALLGLCLGGCLGIAGGLARRSISGAAKAGLLGAALSAALAAGLCLAILPRGLQAQFDYSDYDLIIALFMHSLIWGLPGALAGVAFAIGLGDRRRLGRAFAGAFLGAVLGAIVMEMIGAAFFASAATVKPISSTRTTRLLARLLVTTGTAAGVILLLKPAAYKKSGSPSASVSSPR